MKKPAITSLAVLTLALGACASNDHHAEEQPIAGAALVDSYTDRELTRNGHVAKFKAFRSQCRSEGGRVVIMSFGGVGRDGIPGRLDRYYCQ